MPKQRREEKKNTQMPVTTMKVEKKGKQDEWMEANNRGFAMKRNGRESRRRKCGSNPNAMETHAETAVHRCRS